MVLFAAGPRPPRRQTSPALQPQLGEGTPLGNIASISLTSSPVHGKRPLFEKRHHRAPIARSTLQRNKLLQSIDSLRGSRSMPLLPPNIADTWELDAHSASERTRRRDSVHPARRNASSPEAHGHGMIPSILYDKIAEPCKEERRASSAHVFAHVQPPLEDTHNAEIMRHAAVTSVASSYETSEQSRPSPFPRGAEDEPSRRLVVDETPLREQVPAWWRGTQRKSVLGMSKTYPPDSVLKEVQIASDQFDAQQLQYRALANRIRSGVLVPPGNDGAPTFAQPSADSLGGVKGWFPHPPQLSRAANHGSELQSPCDRAIVAQAAVGEWISPTAIAARREAQRNVFANRYVNPPSLELNSPIAPLQPGKEPPSNGLAWKRPSWWRNEDGTSRTPPFRPPNPLPGVGAKFGPSAMVSFEKANPGSLASATRPRNNEGLRGGFNGSPKRFNGGQSLGVGRAVRGSGAAESIMGGVVATVRTSIDDSELAPPSFSLRLFAKDSFASVFGSVAEEANSSSSSVVQVTLIRLTGGGQSLLMDPNGIRTLGSWREWSEADTFELYAVMS